MSIDLVHDDVEKSLIQVTLKQHREYTCVHTTSENIVGAKNTLYLPALPPGSGCHQVVSGKDEATSGPSHRSAGVSLENKRHYLHRRASI